MPHRTPPEVFYFLAAFLAAFLAGAFFAGAAFAGAAFAGAAFAGAAFFAAAFFLAICKTPSKGFLSDHLHRWRTGLSRSDSTCHTIQIHSVCQP